ncbi:hypothetical protein CU098_008915 [Rhizopus stolonifer]|uniref:Uncharacterized protein n=1 Tax=Rhizopus stolonifer TaxID=4846 RepID=A0A367JC98_RHIST|nr:hypothetical protein CU098_008915 [Rhizopus stolonifer]
MYFSVRGRCFPEQLKKYSSTFAFTSIGPLEDVEVSQPKGTNSPSLDRETLSNVTDLLSTVNTCENESIASFIRAADNDRRTENCPTANEIAAIIQNDAGKTESFLNIKMYLYNAFEELRASFARVDQINE